jgi:hypothetical protein
MAEKTAGRTLSCLLNAGAAVDLTPNDLLLPDTPPTGESTFA